MNSGRPPGGGAPLPGAWRRRFTTRRDLLAPGSWLCLETPSGLSLEYLV